MAFFRKLKFHYRHKKLSEDWGLATSLKDMSELNDPEQCIVEEIDTNSKNNSNTTTFDLKYLGSTHVEAEKSEKSTAEAIKSVLALSKNAKKKVIQKVKVNISPQGIEVINASNGENIVRVSIYKISYCSADATNDHIFAFIGSEADKIANYEQLFCHVFHCPKRKIAHDVTLTVARCFEQAYQKWKEAIDKKILQEELRSNRINKESKNEADLKETLNKNFLENNTKIYNENKENNVEILNNLLIDLSDTNTGNNIYQMKDNRQYLQNTWVSFDDDNPKDQILVC